MTTAGAALVVGAASGIGLETAFTFAARGTPVVVCADQNLEGAQAASEQSKSIATAKEYQTLAVEVDVADIISVERMVEVIARPHEQPVTSFTTSALQDLDRLHDVNTKGMLNCLTHVMKIMMINEERFVENRTSTAKRSVGRGAIVNLVSTAGLYGLQDSVTYTASKHAAIGVNRCAALEARPSRIRINALCPSFADTPMMERGLRRAPELGDLITKAMPFGRMATVEEVAEVAYFLCSDAASFVNGHNMIVDSGASLGT
ncbi:MAG: hypothetical protein Q9159_007151, partial [Coniocarpon cinnabarinum]